MRRTVASILTIALLLSAFVFSGAMAENKYATVTGGWLRLRSAPSMDAPTITSYYTGTVVQLTGSLQNGWYPVKLSDGKTGYMYAAYLSVGGEAPSGGKTAYVTSQNGYGVRMRQGPGTGYRVIRTYPAGTAVTVLSEGTYWSRISVSGLTGYMMTQFLSSGGGVTPGTVQCYATVWSGNGYGVRLRVGPGQQYGVIGKYSVGTSVAVLEKGTVWDKISIGSRVGYMMNQFLIYYGNNELTSVALNNLTPSVNDILAVSSVNPSGATFTYQWLVDNVVKSTAPTYTVTSADVGCRIQLMITGYGNYKGSILSAKTEKVLADKVVKGVELNNYAPFVGDVLTAKLNPVEAEVIFAWMVGNVQKSSAATYTVAESDIGQKICLVVSGKGAYTGSAVSYMTSMVTKKTDTYTVSFDTCGKTEAPASQLIKEGNQATKPADPKAIGYSFRYWELDGMEFNFTTSICSDVTLKAKWDPTVTYTVIFNKGDITAQVQNLPAMQYVNTGMLAAEPSAPTVEGYTFAGWYLGSELFKFDTPVTTSIELKAHWTKDAPEPKVYVVAFNANGHGTAPESQNVIEGLCAKEPQNPTCEGQEFLGWWKDGATKYDFSTPVTGNLTLYAMWTPATTYTVTFNNNGYGTAPAAQYIASGKRAVKPADPSASGQVFLGWYLNSIPYDFSAPVTGNLTLYAMWNAVVPYSVTFNANGHGTAPETQYVQHGQYAVKPANPSAPGWVFLGWYLDASTEYDFSTPVTANVALYAMWNPETTIAVTFNSNGHGTAPATQNIAVGGYASDPGALTAVGYRFTGWKLGGSTFDFASTPITAPIELQAGWEALPLYSVSFNANGHGTAPATQQVYEGSAASNPGDLSETGMVFGGWYLGANPYDFSTAVTDSIILDAKWTIETHTVTFNNNGIGGTVSPVQVSYGQTVANPGSLSSESHNFLGWYTDSAVPYDFSTPVITDITLWAGWEKKTFSVTFDNDGIGSPVSPVTVEYGDQVSNPGSLSATGFIFHGWHVKNSSLYDFSTPVTGNLELIAIWTKQTYTVSFNTSGHAAPISSQTVEYGGTACEPAMIVFPGFNFEGWMNGGSLYDFSNPVYSDLALVAAWSIP